MDSLSIRLASNLTIDSIVDGPGLRTVIWTQGCPHLCPGCHNPQTHDKAKGIEVNINEVIEELKKTKLQTGLTLSGGEPFDQPFPLIEIVKEAKKLHMNIWAFSGYTFEQIKNDKDKLELLKLVDVLVDGRFIESQKDYRLKFKGSKNQRIIDVPKSLETNSIVLSSYENTVD